MERAGLGVEPLGIGSQRPVIGSQRVVLLREPRDLLAPLLEIRPQRRDRFSQRGACLVDLNRALLVRGRERIWFVACARGHQGIIPGDATAGH